MSFPLQLDSPSRIDPMVRSALTHKPQRCHREKESICCPPTIHPPKCQTNETKIFNKAPLRGSWTVWCGWGQAATGFDPQLFTA